MSTTYDREQQGDGQSGLGQLTGNSYLSGVFALVTKEVTAFDLPVDGTIPREIDGLFVRNGPTPISADPAFYHWFLGDGMVHGVELGGGKARSYRNRWVRTDAAAAALGEEPIAGQPTDTPVGGGNTANTNIVTHGGRLLALVEVCLPTELDAELGTIGRYDFGLGLSTAMTAHPHVDPMTGEMIFFGYEMFGPPFMRHHVADAAGAISHSADITLPGPVMMHDFAITAARSVILDLPVVFDFDLLGVRPFPAKWKPRHGARIGVMPRNGTDSEVVWCEIEPCYVFHVLNAFDDGDDVVMDVCRYESMFADDPSGIGSRTAHLERWTIVPAERKVRREIVSELAAEFPRPDERFVGREHRYGYIAVPRLGDTATGFGDVDAISLARVDLRTGDTVVHDFGAGKVAGEGIRAGVRTGRRR